MFSSLLWHYKKLTIDLEDRYVTGKPDKIKPRAIVCQPCSILLDPFALKNWDVSDNTIQPHLYLSNHSFIHPCI
jgi:hypothetical protein